MKIKNILKDNNNAQDALKLLNDLAIKTIFIINNNSELVGTITDGDLRRGFIKGYDFKVKLSKFMKKKFHFIYKNNLNDLQKKLEFFKKNEIDFIPIINNKNKLVKILKLKDLDFKDQYSNPFIIMAGGFGKRMLPLTAKVPKPMLKVDKKPIIEHIINRAKSFGFNNFFISINYLGNQIENYFKNGKKLDVNITYLKEKSPLGTVGSLYLLKKFNITKPIILVNADVLCDINYKSFLDYHVKNNADITIATYLHRDKKEFGIIETKSNKVLEFREKPTFMLNINSGIYALNLKSIESKISRKKYIDMHNIIKPILKKKKVFSYPIYEDWHDVGTKFKLSEVRRKYKKS